MGCIDFHLFYQLHNQAVLYRKKAVQQMFLFDFLIAVVSIFISKLFTPFHSLHRLLCKF